MGTDPGPIALNAILVNNFVFSCSSAVPFLGCPASSTPPLDGRGHHPVCSQLGMRLRHQLV